MKKSISILVAAALVAFLIYAVTYRNKEIPVEKPGTVVATAAYQRYFGAAPSCDKGTAYAFVIFFPSAKIPGKVVPFPFFTFDEGSIKKVAVERLLGGMDIGSYQGEFQPPPTGARLLTIGDDQGLVTVNFSKELDKAPQASIADALALTLRQFKGVRDIRLLVEGKESPSSAMVKGADEGVVQEPSPPRLLNVRATRDKGTKSIEDVSVFFDRPVEVKELKLLSKDGSMYPGDIYHSVFDMAVVLKPKDAAQFKERMPIKVRWRVVDKLGRQAEGDNVWFLEVKEH